MGKAPVSLITFTVLLFSSNIPVSHDRVTVSQRAHQDPETQAAKWNSAIVNFIIYTSAFLSVTISKGEKNL